MKKYWKVLFAVICLASCSSMSEKRQINGNVLQMQITQLTNQIEHQKKQIENQKKEIAMLEPYKGLSEADTKLKLAQLEKAELETRLATEKIQKDEEAKQKAEEEKAAREERDEEQNALREAAEKERVEDEKYSEIGVRPVYINCRWAMTNDLGNQLYVPTINLKLKNVSTGEISNSEVRVVFIDVDKKEIFDETTDYFIYKYTNSPLPIGYSKEIIIKASKGYYYALTTVPTLTAEIYIDDQLLVSVPVTND